jgi:site-specific recombinase XerD
VTYGEEERDLASLVVSRVGKLQDTGDPWEPYQLLDAEGVAVTPVSTFLRELQAAGRSAATQYSYGNDLLRWFRFCWTIGVPWNQATRAEARDFSRWIQISAKTRPRGRAVARDPRTVKPTKAVHQPGTVNPVTGKPSPGRTYAPTTAAHSETVLRSFYEFHLDGGTGPIINPFPLTRKKRAHAHHNAMQPFRNERSGLYRPRVPKRIPRRIPDDVFNELFAKLRYNRDRALVAFWISTGARASELLGLLRSGVDPGQQLITVVRKGSRAMQRLPASPDAFVWLRLYESQMQGQVPAGPDDPVWLTLRRPYRALTYHAARNMFTRANESLGANWSLHDLRHSAAYRMAQDPDMPITDVQWILGHAHLTTTQIYVMPTEDDVIKGAREHFRRQAAPKPPPQPAPGYRAESLGILFGKGKS